MGLPDVIDQTGNSLTDAYTCAVRNQPQNSILVVNAVFPWMFSTGMFDEATVCDALQRKNTGGDNTTLIFWPEKGNKFTVSRKLPMFVKLMRLGTPFRAGMSVKTSKGALAVTYHHEGVQTTGMVRDPSKKSKRVEALIASRELVSIRDRAGEIAISGFPFTESSDDFPLLVVKGILDAQKNHQLIPNSLVAVEKIPGQPFAIERTYEADQGSYYLRRLRVLCEDSYKPCNFGEYMGLAYQSRWNPFFGQSNFETVGKMLLAKHKSIAVELKYTDETDVQIACETETDKFASMSVTFEYIDKPTGKVVLNVPLVVSVQRKTFLRLSDLDSWGNAKADDVVRQVADVWDEIGVVVGK